MPANARACPECGADERTGWDEEASRFDGLDLPDNVFDEDARTERFRRNNRRTVMGLAPFWWVVGIVLLAVLIYGVVFSGFLG